MRDSQNEAGLAEGDPARPFRQTDNYFSVTTVPFFVLHSLSLVSTQPLPLQSFMPLHELVADLQAPLPLQSLMPEHFTLPASFAWTTAGVAAANRPATADATMAPLTVMCTPPWRPGL